MRMIVPVVALAFAVGSAGAQSTPPAADKPAAPSIPDAVARGIAIILEKQEAHDDPQAAPDDPARAEWPYEGVYRVNRRIPIGYRIGGTGICASAIVLAPGYAEDATKQAAVSRAVAYVCQGIEHPLMTPDYDGGYDVRGWGYTYGLRFLLLLKSRGQIPAAYADASERAIRFYIDAIQKTQIPEVGGWNYSRGKINEVAPPSPFMTAPTLQALFEAKAAGYTVEEAVVDRALTFLELSKAPSGSVVYAGKAGDGRRDGVPGAVGRMLSSEVALFLAGRSNQSNVRAAVDAFIVHWEWLNKRRAQTGTHVGPYGVAPYYFYFAHFYAAEAIELLPPHERAEYRRRVNELLFSVRLEDGSWNDRVFPRSAAYGTAMATMALLAPDLPPATRWKPDAPK
ncbi:MAG: terpene cyclase/mutase family protein [Phycisphaeraceae bacterium]|nr:terpene cyclase/mutase family protein [Phycisphaeraceae bacterium]